MINILLSGAGGGACIGVIKSLRMDSRSYNIVVTDTDELSAGFSLADKSYLVPPANEKPIFIKKIEEIVEKENIDMILPTSGFDIEPLSDYKKEIESTGVKMLMNNYKTVMLCHDKLKLKNTFKRLQYPYIPSKGPYKRYRFEKEKGGNTFKEEYLPGEEYTVDTISDMNGNCIMAVPRLRIKTIGSYSYKGEIVLNKKIINICKHICNSIGLKGVNCIQLKRDKNQRPKLVEVNPRFGGSTHFTTLAGANFAKMLIDIGLGKEIKEPKVKQIKIVRYFNEVII